jgi:hypothetical protein
LDREWYGPTLRVLQREYDNGASTRELALAHEVRLYWSSQPHFSHFVKWTGERLLRYELLPWPTAIGLVRDFRGVPDLQEIELTLDQAFQQWSETDKMHQAFPSFYSFVRSTLEGSCADGLSLDWSACDDQESALDNDDWLDQVRGCENFGLSFHGDGELARMDRYRGWDYRTRALRGVRQAQPILQLDDYSDSEGEED